jgi:hypothetical protein
MHISYLKGESSGIEVDAAADSLRESLDQANDQSRTSFPHDDDDDDDDDDSVLTSANLRTDEDDDSHYEECSNPYSNSEHAYSSGIVCSVSIKTGGLLHVYHCYSSVRYIIQFRSNLVFLAFALCLFIVKIL